MSSDSIGCSLAEAAESVAYETYLEQASRDGHPGLHVIYINTSLKTKALSHNTVPTITCTSSNVVNTVLQVGNTPFCVQAALQDSGLLTACRDHERSVILALESLAMVSSQCQDGPFHTS